MADSDPYPLAQLSPRPAYAVSETDAVFVVEVVVPFNEGTVAEARSAALDAIGTLTIDAIPGLRAELGARATHAEAVAAALIFG